MLQEYRELPLVQSVTALPIPVSILLPNFLTIDYVNDFNILIQKRCREPWTLWNQGRMGWDP